ncbi:bacterial regulatory helix-turn-helix, lysR family protein [Candidatus Erwinia dacicola]|uniref:Bacterial regulatory helix-turn-helix, lysR family protein n=1 Tax=Candidatus Erwinia dacicola TaxID=252393 RepID=A0A328TQS2_9GAMM|nr:bacterial regulatory helix-turn-helix, lysR family protein [Candidatus Erwinia dacicola]
MAQMNYNHLYYFWQVCKTDAAAVLNFTSQTVTGQLKTLEERLQGKLFKR